MEAHTRHLERVDHPILIVDDDPVIRESMQGLLELEGYPVAVASDGEEALQQLRLGLDPSLILLDISMPVKDGFQFRAEQLADARWAAIPTIIWSARYDPQQEIMRGLGATVLHKGVDFEILLECIETHRQKH